MSQRQPMWSLRVIGGLVQGDEAELRANFDVIGTDDLPSLATVAVTSFNTRVGDVTFVATDLPTSGVSPGTIDLPTVTVDQYGRVTSIIASPTVLVQSVTSSGGTLTVTGTTTTNVEIALGHANTWTAAQAITLSASAVAFTISGAAVQATDLFRIYPGFLSSGGAVWYPLSVNKQGALVFTNYSNTQVGYIGPDPSNASQYVCNLPLPAIFWASTSLGNVAAYLDTSGIIDYGANGSQVGNWRLLCNHATGFIRIGKSGDTSHLPAVQCHVLTRDAVTNAVTAAAYLDHESSGTPAAGYGVSLHFRLQSSTTTGQAAAAIETSWATATHATRKARCVFSVYDTAAREALRMEADGARAWSGVPAGNSTSFAKLGGALFDHHADAGNTHTDGTDDDLYSDTTPASVLGTNDEKLSAWYAGVFVSSATATRQIKIWFAGTAIFDSGALTLSLSAAWTCYVEIIRVSSTVIRYAVSMTTEGAALAAYTAAGELTGLTLSGTNIFKITGAAAGVGAAASDVLAKAGSVSWGAAA